LLPDISGNSRGNCSVTGACVCNVEGFIGWWCNLQVTDDSNPTAHQLACPVSLAPPRCDDSQSYLTHELAFAYWWVRLRQVDTNATAVENITHVEVTVQLDIASIPVGSPERQRFSTQFVQDVATMLSIAVRVVYTQCVVCTAVKRYSVEIITRATADCQVMMCVRARQPERVQIERIMAGSVIVVFALLPDSSGNPVPAVAVSSHAFYA
jgi:hypothetical protein